MRKQVLYFFNFWMCTSKIFGANVVCLLHFIIFLIICRIHSYLSLRPGYVSEKLNIKHDSDISDNRRPTTAHTVTTNWRVLTSGLPNCAINRKLGYFLHVCATIEKFCCKSQFGLFLHVDNNFKYKSYNTFYFIYI